MELQARCEYIRTLMNQMPKEKLGFFPTPFYKLERLSTELGVSLFIKRDDFTGMNLFGGNKVRKLQYLMGAEIHIVNIEPRDTAVMRFPWEEPVQWALQS